MTYVAVHFLASPPRLLTLDEWARLDMATVDRSIPWKLVNAEEHAARVRRECAR